LLAVACGASPAPPPSAEPKAAPAASAPLADGAATPSKGSKGDSGRTFADCPRVGIPVGEAGPPNEGQKRHDELTVLLQAHRDKFRCCYDVARASTPSLKGDYMLEIVLKTDGSIKDVSQKKENSTLSDDGMTGCMIAVARTLVFPASSEKKETTIPYRFGFTPGGGR
jgi:hypothetical protein